MEAWRQSVTKLKQGHPHKAQAVDHLLSSSESAHTWVQLQYTPTQLLKRPRFCNVCRDKLTGFPHHGWSCDICKIKTHRKCMNHVADKCKWTVGTLIPQHIQYISPENSIMSHQWVEGNISPSSRCAVCEKNCGSSLRLQDWRCLWCASTVHDGCLSNLGRGCSLGAFAISCVPPLSVNEVSPEGEFLFRPDAIGAECGGSSPLCILVNSKSGDSQGQRMIRKFKRLLNPIQVFDIINSGPEFALTLFKSLDSFRVLVCGGDGTVGWVLSTLDKLDIHKKCQLAVLPLGTGNDLARVLGWGHAFYNVHELPSLLQEFERAPTSMLDRWSVMIMDGPNANAIKEYEIRLKQELKQVLMAEEPHDTIIAVRQLCGTVTELLKDVSATYTKVEEWENLPKNDTTDDPVIEMCSTLMVKLDNVRKTLGKHRVCEPQSPGESGFEAETESAYSECPEETPEDPNEERLRRDSLVCRANSLKKAIKDIMNMAERGLDQYMLNENAASAKRQKFRKQRSKTTPGLKVSSSNLSSSSACSPPVSPSLRKERLAVDRPATGTSGCGPSPNFSSTAGHSSANEENSTNGVEGTEESDENTSTTNIGQVQPPTPASTREHSTTGEPDRPPLEGERERLFKPVSESQLFPPPPADIKLSHSDSSIFDHSAGSSKEIRYRNGRLDPRFDKDKKRMSAQENPREEESYVVGGSLIAEVLLLNASVLGMASGVIQCTPPLDAYREQKVMNNYFGIGLDAKIALDFHNKREGSEKTRSRSKLFLWYGMLGGKELMHRTYRNLEQRIRLECDGVPIDLPSLQGIVILNIPSYSGGANFWGTAKEDGFVAQSFDDRLLEVVALFGVMHVATSRVPNVVRLQNHRIAQCRHVRIVILGQDPIPVQVDGEPWMQPPGILQIVHKNRAQLLVRDPAFDATLKKWEEQKERSTAPSTPTAIGVTFARRAGEFLRLVESELANLGVSSAFLEAMDTATNALRTLDQSVRERQKREAKGEEEEVTEASESGQEEAPGGSQVPDESQDVTVEESEGRERQQSDRIQGGPAGRLRPQEEEDLADESQDTFDEGEVIGRGRAMESESDGQGTSDAAVLKKVKRQSVPVDLAALAEMIGLDSTTDDERSDREEVLAAVEEVVDLLEAHFGWPENKVPANQPRLGPAPHFSFEIHGDEPDQWRYVISCVRQEISREEAALRELNYPVATAHKKRGRFTKWISKQWRRRSGNPSESVAGWTIDEVSAWLGTLGLSQYADQFKVNDVRGAELLHLEKPDLNDLGVTKIGHIKRIQTAIGDLLESEKQRRRSGRKGVSLSVERPSVPVAEPPSLSSL